MDLFVLEKNYTEPSEKYNLMSIVLFKLKHSYKNFEKYLNGFDTLLDKLHKILPGFYLRFYYDNSIFYGTDEDKEITNKIIKLFNKAKNIEWVQIVRYEHPWFKKDEIFHEGLFGTLVRLLPLFDDSNTNIVLIGEIDVSYKLYNAYKLMYKKFKNTDAQVYFATHQCYEVLDRYYAVSQYWRLYMIPLIGVFWSKMKFPKYLFNDFLTCIHENKLEGECKYLGIFEQSTNIDRTHIMSPDETKLLKFGIDEIMAGYLIKYLIDNKIPYMVHLVPTLYKIIHDIFKKNPEYYQSQKHIDLIKSIMGSAYNENKNLDENLQTLWNAIQFDFVSNHKNPDERKLIKNTFFALINLLKNNNYKEYGFEKKNLICVKHHYNIFNIATLLCEGYKCVDVKKLK